jgi:hypothetical protein
VAISNAGPAVGGLQIVGSLHDDLGGLRASAAFQAIAPSAQHRPKMG